MKYRQELDKIYKKLDSLSQRGDDALMDFRDYIDQLVEYGQYGVLIDVMDLKYSIDIRGYKSVEDMKKDVFKKIKFQTKSKFAKNLKTLFDTKNVYTNGYHYYDSLTNKYLGDINEIETYSKYDYAYYDTRLNKRLNESSDISLKITLGVSSSIYSAVPQYLTDPNRVINYGTNSQVVYEGFVYDCINEYTWSYGSPITPTYSEYWSLTNVPTYSIFGVTEPSKTLLEKYSEAIDIMKNLN